MRDATVARPFFRRALERDPTSFRAALGMGSTALMQRDVDAAAKAFGDGAEPDEGQGRTRLPLRRDQRAEQGAQRHEGDVLNTQGVGASLRASTKILPGGVDSPVRAFKAVGASPLFIHRAAGARLEDIDGNTYIDYVMSGAR